MKIDSLIKQNTELNGKFWMGDSLKSKFRIGLVDIAKKFYEDLELPMDALKDITFTGSLANYNYTSASDIDLHLIVDFAKIDDNNQFLVNEFFKAVTSNWNRMHTIMMKGHEIEIYAQDSTEAHYSTGVYSLLSNGWLTKPEVKEQEVDKKLVDKKVVSFMKMIDDVQDLYDDKYYEQAQVASKKLMKKIKKYRSAGLSDDGEFSVENIVFKYLRNNNYIKLLIDIRNNSYDKFMSINGHPEKKFKIYVEQEPEKIKTYNRLNELERYQRNVQRDHTRKKRSTIGGGENVTPGFFKSNYKRSKSAPPGFGGS